MKQHFLLLLSNFIFIGCHPLFCNWEKGYDQVTTSPDPRRISGIYSLNNQSVKFLTSQGFKVDSCILEIKENGQFILANVPDIALNSFSESKNTYETKTGKWNICKYEESGCLMELEGICVEPFLEGHGKFAISKTLGDPDNCEGIIFEKIK